MAEALPASRIRALQPRRQAPVRSSMPDEDARRRRRVRRSVFILSVVVLALYFGFILYAVVYSRH